MTGTQNILIGIAVTTIGIVTLASPGGWDWLSVINIWMGGLVFGLGLVARWSR